MGKIVDGRYEVDSVVTKSYSIEEVEREIAELEKGKAEAQGRIDIYNARIVKLEALKTEMENAGVVIAEV